MFKGRSRVRRGQSNNGGATKIPLRGLFSNGVWHCNCDPRLPAQHFQTKNGGKNHGRWFYTCQLPQPKRCDFFLWDDEAKGREAAAVLNNSRTEPVPAPITPTKPAPTTGLVTPQTRRRRYDEDVRTPYTPSKTAAANAIYSSNREGARGADTQATATTTASSDEEFYDWPASDDEEMGKVADQASSNQSSLEKNAMQPPETPRKALKTDALSTPGKRRFAEMNEDAEAGAKAWPTPSTTGRGDVFTTPSTVPNTRGLFLSNSTTLLSPAETPTPIRFKDIPTLGQETDLASEILSSLPTAIPNETQQAIKTICSRNAMHTSGIMKGREVSRATVQKRDERIAELTGEIEGLKSERETNRAVIRHLRRDVAARKEGGLR